MSNYLSVYYYLFNNFYYYLFNNWDISLSKFHILFIWFTMFAILVSFN